MNYNINYGLNGISIGGMNNIGKGKIIDFEGMNDIRRNVIFSSKRGNISEDFLNSDKVSNLIERFRCKTGIQDNPL